MRNGIQYIHLRRPVVKVERKGMWMGDIAPTGGLTVAVHKMPDGTVKLGFARCNLSDRYNRKLGCEQALRNMEKRANLLAFSDSPQDFYETVLEIALNDSQLRRNLKVEVRHG